jgi:mannitol 2-dehydrogenase
MVDRITPVTKQSDIENLKSVYAIDDAWPVTCEPFIQWVIEDNYSNGRPAWESAGVQFVQDVDPFEKMKIRLLNAGHSLLGFMGSLHGFNTIDETVRFPLFGSFLREFMDIEVTPVLSKVEGVDIDDYKASLVQRFGNPNIKDQLSRICGESSAKIPKFLLPTIKEQLEKGGPVERGATVIAAWCRYLELAGTPGHNWIVQDNMKDVLTAGALSSQKKDPLAFLKIETIFNDLAENKRFTDIYLPIIESLRNNEVTEVINNLEEILGR